MSKKIFTFLMSIFCCLLPCSAFDIPNPNFNNDNLVNIEDFAILANNWQQSGAGLKGDFDDSNSVDADDLFIFSWYWLTEYSEYQQCEGIGTDLDGDGIVAFEDLARFAQNWLLTGTGLTGDFDASQWVDCNDLSILADCWLKGTRPLNVWEQFKDALADGDINQAITYFTEVSAENYRVFFEQLSSYLPQMASEMGELIFLEQKEKIAYYDLLREENGDTYGYPVIFVRNETGQWKIYDFQEYHNEQNTQKDITAYGLDDISLIALFDNAF